MVAEPRPVYCLLGPTAAGKTAVAVALAERVPVEIISVDSGMVYRGMDIGTAKPDAETLRKAPHHLLDIRDPAYPYSAAEFRADALRLIEEIHERGRYPLLVGGTMLYFRVLTQGMTVLPEADAALRQRLDVQAAEEGWPAMHRYLAEVDPQTASRLKPGDKQRIQRALEVYYLTGQPLSYWHTHGKTVNDFPYQLHAWALIPENRAWLHDAIAHRLDIMWQSGLVNEVTALWQRGDLHADLPAIRAVGYRQVWQYLEGQITEQDMRHQVLFATRQLAKRQLTWLRSFSGLSCWDPQRQSIEDIVMQLLKNFA